MAVRETHFPPSLLPPTRSFVTPLPTLYPNPTHPLDARMRDRYARNVCSLVASSSSENLMSGCQVESLYGASNGRVHMAFGETNCTVWNKRE